MTNRSGVERVRAQLTKWREEVINLARNNRLLYFRHLKTSTLEIAAPSPGDVLRGLNGAGWAFYFPPEPDPDQLVATPAPPRPDELVTDKANAQQLLNSLTSLARRSEQEFMDKGLWILYLGVGMLSWRDEVDREAESPVLLVPVQLVRGSPREPYRLARVDEDPAVNPALVVKLAEFDIALPQADDVGDADGDALFARVKRAIRGVPGWSLAPRVVLGLFSFQKEVMYRDLLDNENQIAEHPLVASLAAGSVEADAELDFEPIPESELDESAPPEDLATILDADASQRQCIVAARDGHSFVLDGPPGTGKSQTIANIIAELLRQGRTVLFVSEKAAALEVVQKRLEERGLGDFLLELHSHKATRREVARALAEPLIRRPTAGPRMSETSRSRLVQRRRLLSAHAAAMNEVREPLGQTLHQVIGRISQLAAAPQIPLPGVDHRLAATELAEVLDAANRLERAWAPVERGDDFLWREPSPSALDPARRGEIAEELHAAGRALAALQAAARDSADELGLPWWRSVADARRLARLVDCVLSRKPAHEGWLTTSDLGQVRARSAELEAASAEHRRLVDELHEGLGERWPEVDPGGHARLTSACEALRDTPLAPILHASTTASVAYARAGFLAELADALLRMDGGARHIAEGLGLPSEAPRLADARRLAELVQLFADEPRPEACWLTTAGLVRARKAVASLRPLIDSWISLRDDLTDVFSDGVLDVDLEGLKARFESVHRGLGRLRSAYRADKRVLAGVTRTRRVDANAIAKLPTALEWKRRDQELADAEREFSDALGAAYRRDKTDFDELERLLDRAHRAIALSGDRGFPQAVAARLGRGGTIEPGLVQRGRSIGALADEWPRRASTELGNGASALEAMPLADAADASADFSRRLLDVARVLEQLSDLAGRDCTLEEAEEMLSVRARAIGIEEAVRATRATDGGLLGTLYDGLDTDWARLRAGIDWTEEIRGLLGGPLDERQVKNVDRASLPPEGLRSYLADWDEALKLVLAEFSPSRRPELQDEFEGAFEDVSQLIDALEESRGDLDVWQAHARAVGELESLGFSKGLKWLIRRQAAASEVAAAIELGCLRAWVESVMKSDAQRLEPQLLASDRDELLEEFRRLDRQLVDRVANDVIDRCNARRPRSVVGAAAIIMREAEKKSRHMPVRKLLADTGGLPLELKPCFLMSPLTVSQFLPPEMRFDAVIFDEASQVRPADAINCVYRGSQLIVAGDQRQLPPTSFFERFTQEEGDEYQEDQLEEFDSILDLCKGSGSLRTLSLRWHYRSRHESLITYSNYSFYDGRLITFPGARENGDDVGIALIPVQGVYRRGGARDNPIEAATAVDRVLHHARAHHDLTLGVVAFSEAQASAIEAELDRRRQELPELDDFFDSDRLNGFFIKNLENVQGDERDIIIFSIGYGPDEAGKLTMNFGPLNIAGGHRRLNVAITRARRRVEIVSSISAADLRHDTGSEGVRHLRRYLDFAERGLQALALDIAADRRDVESPFEEEVARTIRSWGHDVVPQVGSAGYRIDLAVRDPNQPGRFVLGVECDGAMYHSSRVARDRDRLRQEVLEGLGWRIHRIWGTSWYRDRAGQEARLREAIERAMSERATRRTAPARSVAARREPAHEYLESDAAPDWTTPYVICRPSAPTPLLEMHDQAAQADLKRMIREVVAVEAPVLEDVVLRRVREAWGVARAGQRIRAAFKRAVGDLERRDVVRIDAHGFLWTSSTPQFPVRVPTPDDPATERDVSELHPLELAAAVARLVADARRIGHEDLSVGVARLFGWARRGSGIARAVDDAIETLLQQNVVVRVGQDWLAPADGAGRRTADAR